MVSVCHHYATSDCQAVSLISPRHSAPFFFFSVQSASLPSILPLFFLAVISTSSPSPCSVLLLHFPFHPSIHPSLSLSSLAPFISASLAVCCHFFSPSSSCFLFFLFSLNAFLSRSFCVLFTLSPAYFYPPPNDPLLLFVCFCYRVCVCCAEHVCGFAHAQASYVNEGPLQCQTCCVQSMLLPVTHIVYEYIRLVNNPPFSCSLSLLLLLLPYVSLYLQTPRLF